MFQVGDVGMIQILANVLGCEVGFLPSSYPGLPLGAKFKSEVIWNLMPERISSLLNSWKTPLLSKGGRLVLNNSTLVSIPNYFLTLFTISAFNGKENRILLLEFLMEWLGRRSKVSSCGFEDCLPF